MTSSVLGFLCRSDFGHLDVVGHGVDLSLHEAVAVSLFASLFMCTCVFTSLSRIAGKEKDEVRSSPCKPLPENVPDHSPNTPGSWT